MIAHDDEERIFEPRLAGGSAEELADRVVGIFDGASAAGSFGREVDFALGKGERAMIGCRHDKVKKGFARTVIAVGLAQNPAE